MALKTRVMLAAAVIFLFILCGCNGTKDTPENEQNIQAGSSENETTDGGLQLVPDSGTYSDLG